VSLRRSSQVQRSPAGRQCERVRGDAVFGRPTAAAEEVPQLTGDDGSTAQAGQAGAFLLVGDPRLIAYANITAMMQAGVSVLARGPDALQRTSPLPASAFDSLYPIRYTTSCWLCAEWSDVTQSHSVVERARRLAGLSRSELARRAGASRPTLAAYAAGAKSPTLSTAERIVRAAGFELDIVRRPTFREAAVGRGRVVYVPDHLLRLPVERALQRVRLPLHLNWSQPGREFDLSDRRQRARVYEIVLREGTGDDITEYIDGALLADLWPELVLPGPIRRQWQPLIDTVSGHAA